MTRACPAPCMLDTASFDAIAELAYRESGLTLIAEKSTMMQSRLRHRLRALGLEDFAQYSAFVQSEGGMAERRQLISALTTNVSHFFRETHHFDAMCTQVKARLQQLRAGGRMRIWSAGCSNGQEPLSAAIALLEALPEVAKLDLRILATDIDPKVIRFARAAEYPERLTTGLSQSTIERYFDKKAGENDNDLLTPRPVLKSLIRYNELNLLSTWPMQHGFDAIFCRNVVIYFDLPTQEALWPRFRAGLNQGGQLFLGHSERIANPERHGFRSSGPTTYQAV